MVDADLATAAEELRGEFEQLDPMSIAVTGGGIGIGLFSGEFVAEIIGNTFTSGGGRTRTAVEIASKFGTAGAFILGRRFVGGQLLGVLAILAAAGSAASGVLQMFEAVISGIQTGEFTGSATANGSFNGSTSESIDAAQDAGGAQAAELSAT